MCQVLPVDHLLLGLLRSIVVYLGMMTIREPSYNRAIYYSKNTDLIKWFVFVSTMIYLAFRLANRPLDLGTRCTIMIYR